MGSGKSWPEQVDDLANAIVDGPQNAAHAERDGAAAYRHGLLERYLAGDLSVYVVVSPILGSEPPKHLAIFKGQIGTGEAGNFSGRVVEPYLADAYHTDRDKAMLVGVIQCLENPKRILFRGGRNSLVGLFAFDERPFAAGNAIYHSARQHSVFMRVFEYGELMPSAVLEESRITVHNDQLMDQVVEGGTQLIDSFSGQKDERNVGILDGIVTNSDESAGPTLEIWLHQHTIGVRSAERSELLFQVVDMGYGPV